MNMLSFLSLFYGFDLPHYQVIKKISLESEIQEMPGGAHQCVS